MSFLKLILKIEKFIFKTRHYLWLEQSLKLLNIIITIKNKKKKIIIIIIKELIKKKKNNFFNINF